MLQEASIVARFEMGSVLQLNSRLDEVQALIRAFAISNAMH